MTFEGKYMPLKILMSNKISQTQKNAVFPSYVNSAFKYIAIYMEGNMNVVGRPCKRRKRL